MNLCNFQNGVMNGTVLGMKYMGKDNGGNGGVIVNMSSVVGLSCSPGFPVYSATEYAIVGMSKSFAVSEIMFYSWIYKTIPF